MPLPTRGLRVGGRVVVIRNGRFVVRSKRLIDPILVTVITFRSRFSLLVSWRYDRCPKASPVISARSSTGDN